MTLYLVKWADGSSALITAQDEEHLVELLDQLADPGLASWQEYDGPLWLEFPRPEKAVAADKADVDPHALGWEPPILPGTDWACEFVDAMMQELHPHTSRVREQAMEEDKDIPAQELALAMELDQGYSLPGALLRKEKPLEN